MSNSSQSTPQHKYNTRLSAKVSATSFVHPSKNLIVNLSNSKVHSSGCWPNHKRNFSREPSETLDDSSVFQLESLSMDLCSDPYGRHNRFGWNWTKYLIGLVAVAVVVIPIVRQILNDIHRINHEVHRLKSDLKEMMDDRFNKELSKIEILLTDIKKGQDISHGDLKDIVKHEIDKLAADKTGRTDFALQSAGGRIVQLTSGTENFGNAKSTIFGISLCKDMHGPMAMIQAGISPGECWAFKGSSGGVIVRLLGSVQIDAVTIEHISKKISPTGHVSTALKDFAVWGMRTATDRGTSLGNFVYDIDGPLVQTFPTIASSTPFEYVELQVKSNHGHPDYTCVYRFRVHGTLDQFPNGKKL